MGAYIKTRSTRAGEKRYLVVFRRGGRYSKTEHAGSFKTLKEARTRRDLVAGELAGGRDPRLLLERLKAPPVAMATFAEHAKRWLDSRIDLDASSRETYGAAIKRMISGPVGRRDPRTLTVAEIQELVAEHAGALKPASLEVYMRVVRQVLDFAGVTPNPARDKRVKLPKIEREEPQPPSAAHVLAILERVSLVLGLPLVAIEQTACRVGEIQSLRWGDVDVAGCRFRVRARETKTSRAKWVQVPAWLMRIISESCPLEDRVPERRVFPGFNDSTARTAMRRACTTAGIPHYHPHDLRHRRASLWHGQGLPAKQLAERLGHSRASMSLDVYSHVMPLEELPRPRLEQLLAAEASGR